MNVEEIQMKKEEKLQRMIVEFELSVQRREDYSSIRMASNTLKLLKRSVKIFDKVEDIEKNLIHITKRLKSAVPSDVIVANFCNRVIDILNEELNTYVPIFDQTTVSHDVRRSQSLSLLELFASPQAQHSAKDMQKEKASDKLRNELIKGIRDLKSEIPAVHQDISKYAMDYIHDGDILMTIGSSTSVFAFFQRASVHRKFTVIIPEHAPSYDGIKAADRLRNAGIECAVIPDSAVFAIMPKITTVFCPCRAIFADGTLVTTSFVQSVSLAARHHSKPFVILYWKCKLTDRFLKPKDMFTVLASPNDIVPLDDVVAKNATILNPDGECINGHFVTLYINEDGPHGPADIFTLVHEFYHPNE